MARIAGVNLPFNKRVEIGLRYIYGVGPKRAHDVCEELNIVPSRRIRDLTDDEVVQIRVLLEKKYLIEGDLRQERYNAIKRLTDIGCYRGLRHRKRLPVRGQRTSSNSRTARKGLSL